MSLHNRISKHIFLTCLLVIFGMLAGCQMAEPAAPTGEEAGAAQPGGANSVQVGETEYEINMPTSIPAGATAFEVTNNGTIEHNFEVEGQGIEEEFEQNLQPGETQTLEVELPPGDYVVYCPVANHRELGMEVQLTVTEDGT